MLKKRIIACLDIKDGRTVKGVRFGGLKDAGDPVELARRYAEESADELIFLDISASLERRKTLVELVERISAEIDIPFTVGGGISSTEQAEALIKAGADKVSINSAALVRPKLISEIAQALGSQAVVVAIDSKQDQCQNWVYALGGNQKTNWKTEDWAKEVEMRGAGEILLTSMDHDGVKKGFALDLTEAIQKLVKIPVIASGGAGAEQHFEELFTQTNATGALAASVFHYGQIAIPTLKKSLKDKKIALR